MLDGWDISRGYRPRCPRVNGEQGKESGEEGEKAVGEAGNDEWRKSERDATRSGGRG